MTQTSRIRLIAIASLTAAAGASLFAAGASANVTNGSFCESATRAGALRCCDQIGSLSIQTCEDRLQRRRKIYVIKLNPPLPAEVAAAGGGGHKSGQSKR